MKETIRRVDEKISDLELLLLAYPDDIEGNAPMRAVIQDSIDALKYAVCEFTAQAGAALREEKSTKDERASSSMAASNAQRFKDMAIEAGFDIPPNTLELMGQVYALSELVGVSPFALVRQILSVADSPFERNPPDLFHDAPPNVGGPSRSSLAAFFGYPHRI